MNVAWYALWFIVAAVCVYAIGYRFYSAFLAAKVFALDPTRATNTSTVQVSMRGPRSTLSMPSNQRFNTPSTSWCHR